MSVGSQISEPQPTFSMLGRAWVLARWLTLKDSWWRVARGAAEAPAIEAELFGCLALVRLASV